MKQLTHFAHYYPNAEWWIKRHDDEGVIYPIRSAYMGNNSSIEEQKLILRPFTSMTELEFRTIFKSVQPDDISDEQYKDAISNVQNDGFDCLDFGDMPAGSVFELIHQLLQRNFDLFGLLESELAIESEELTPNQ